MSTTAMMMAKSPNSPTDQRDGRGDQDDVHQGAFELREEDGPGGDPLRCRQDVFAIAAPALGDLGGSQAPQGRAFVGRIGFRLRDRGFHLDSLLIGEAPGQQIRGVPDICLLPTLR